MQTDVLVIGCGIAGAAAALELAEDRARQITVVTQAAELGDCDSSRAQGGIVSRAAEDTPGMLAADVMAAGAGLSLPAAVELLAQQGPKLLAEVLQTRAGVEFDRDDRGELRYGLEGAHSRRRILHVGDTTGRAIMDAMLRALRERPNVRLLTGRTAVDLIALHGPPACGGAYVLNRRRGALERIGAGFTILATGGAGQVYLNSSNRPDARGDGPAMAARAGARLANMEYVQFHPTTLHMPGTTKLLISEAVRGEGALLLSLDGRRFMERHEPRRKELAARDVVARAIYWETRAGGRSHVLLDIASQRPAHYIRRRFPYIHRACRERGFDMASEPIPVAPAAHYLCGGVQVDRDGRSSLSRLYAVGETSCTGVHGANRLASTSLLEGLVWGTRAARDIRSRRNGVSPHSAERTVPEQPGDADHEADPALIEDKMQAIRELMWRHVGLVRNEHGLNAAIRGLTRLRLDIEQRYRESRPADALVGLRNAAQTALAIARAARRNRTSRGCHYRLD